MKKAILVAGATGDLGGRIVKALIAQGADVSAIVRKNTDAKKILTLEKQGITVLAIDMSNDSEIAKACEGISCVVSALAGLKEAIVDAQISILEGAIKAGVPRFIPSDFSTDFTTIPMGENRNFDLRKIFRTHLDKSNIKATSIFNGAFAEILSYNTPIFDTVNKSISYYDDKQNWKVDFTTMDDTAKFTALVAMDDEAPRNLNISSFRLSPNDFVAISEKVRGEKFDLVDNGSLANFSTFIKRMRASDPDGENNMYPKWQQAQYIHSMFYAHNTKLDNDRYPNLTWESIESYI